MLTGLIVLAACFSDRSSSTSPDLANACDISLPPELLGSTVVAIRNFGFEPQQVTVAEGATVTWINCAPADEPSHTSTSDTGEWGSELLPPGSFSSFRFTRAGSFAYHCEPHPFMTGEIVVQ